MSANLNESRYSANGVLLSDNEFWIAGGNYESTSEIFRSGNSFDPEYYVDLPEPMGLFNMFMINETNAALISLKTYDVYIFDKTSEKFTLVPNKMNAWRELPFAGNYFILFNSHY